MNLKLMQFSEKHLHSDNIFSGLLLYQSLKATCNSCWFSFEIKYWKWGERLTWPHWTDVWKGGTTVLFAKCSWPKSLCSFNQFSKGHIIEETWHKLDLFILPPLHLIGRCLVFKRVYKHLWQRNNCNPTNDSKQWLQWLHVHLSMNNVII